MEDDAWLTARLVPREVVVRRVGEIGYRSGRSAPNRRLSSDNTVKYHVEMAVVGPSRQSRHGGGGGVVGVAGVGVGGGSAFHSASSGAAHQAILAAAQPYYPHHANSHHSHAHQPSSSPAAANPAPSTGSQDLQPDRPIGYGAFGVVWWVFISILQCYPRSPIIGQCP